MRTTFCALFAAFMMLATSAHAEPNLADVRQIQSPMYIEPQAGWQADCVLGGEMPGRLSSSTSRLNDRILSQVIDVSVGVATFHLTVDIDTAQGSVVDVRSSYHAPGLTAEEAEQFEFLIEILENKFGEIFESVYRRPLVSGKNFYTDREVEEMFEGVLPGLTVDVISNDRIVKGLVSDGEYDYVLLEGPLQLVMAIGDFKMDMSANGQSLIHVASGFHWELWAEESTEVLGEREVSARSMDCAFTPPPG